MTILWQPLAEQLAAGMPAVVGIVAQHTPGSPGTTGAKILALADGGQLGTIGGGIMEQRFLEFARASLAARQRGTAIVTLEHRRTGTGEKSGLICSGSQTNVTHYCDPATDLATVRALATAVDGTLTVSARGLALDPTPCDLAASPFRLEQESADTWVYAEQLLNRRRIAIVGAGHCGQALSRTMRQLGYDVVVFDTRPDRASGDAADLVDDYADVGARIRRPDITPVVVMTTDCASDVRALLGVVGRTFPFIGVMGSAAKLAEIRRALGAAGVPRKHVDALHAPVGLPIGSHTPEEIAISIAAQLIQRRGT